MRKRYGSLRLRQNAFDLYWKFAFERQSLFERRVHGSAPPWTDDQILRTYKFCNVFRASDRVSQYLIAHVAYGSADISIADRLFQIVMFRLFSKPETWESLSIHLGSTPRLEHLRDGRLLDALQLTRSESSAIYTSAFILCASNAYERPTKHENHIELLKDMFIKNELAKHLTAATSLKSVYALLRRFPLIGDFMAYQIAIDLNYSAHIEFDEDDFTQPGPGALRGIKKAFESTASYSEADVIRFMVDSQEREFERLGLRFGGLWGRRLHAIDCQGLFCELDKYCREALPELPSNRKRIKARFTQSPKPLRLFYPPKWHINENIPMNVRLRPETLRKIDSASEKEFGEQNWGLCRII